AVTFAVCVSVSVFHAVTFAVSIMVFAFIAVVQLAVVAFRELTMISAVIRVARSRRAVVNACGRPMICHTRSALSTNGRARSTAAPKVPTPTKAATATAHVHTTATATHVHTTATAAAANVLVRRISAAREDER